MVDSVVCVERIRQTNKQKNTQVGFLTGQVALWVFVALPITIATIFSVVLLITAAILKIKNKKQIELGLSSSLLSLTVFLFFYVAIYFLVVVLCFVGAYHQRNSTENSHVWFFFLFFFFLLGFAIFLVFFCSRVVNRLVGREMTFELNSSDNLLGHSFDHHPLRPHPTETPI